MSSGRKSVIASSFAPVLDQDAIADSLENHIEAFQKAFVWTVFFAAIIGLGSMDGKSEAVSILGVDIGQANAYAICLGIYTILDGVFIAQALSILFAFRRLDDEKVSTGATKLLVAPGILNPFACLGRGSVAHLISAASYGAPLFIWWLMYLSTLGLETAAGARSALRHAFIASGALTGWAFGYCYLNVLRRLRAADSPLFGEVQRLALPKLGAAVVFFWIGSYLYHVARHTSVRTVWEYLDILFFYPVVMALPWWREFKTRWLTVLGACGVVLASAAWFFNALKCGIMIGILAAVLLILAALKQKWERFRDSGLLTKQTA